MGGQNLSEFISLGASRATVTLDFDLQGERYRVVRTMPRLGAKKAQLERITAGKEQPIADAIRTVDDKLQSLLGLKYEAFIQSVLLPQGESNPADRQKILSDRRAPR